MDRSFLADANVIGVSRQFVCIRLATYEDAEEAKFLKNIFSGRSGELDNTVFALLAPDGKTQLCRPGRSPNFAFRNPAEMASRMVEISGEYPGNDEGGTDVLTLPAMKNFRLALNVAACDGLPLVVGIGTEPDKKSTGAAAKPGDKDSDKSNKSAENDLPVDTLRKLLVPVAFTEQLAGKFHYYTTTDPKELSAVTGYRGQEGVFLIAPAAYGLEGEVVAQWTRDLETGLLAKELLEKAGQYQKTAKSHNQHVRSGRQNNIEWETEIPVTDPDALRAQGKR
jgi:hypothetical protein